MHISSHVRHEHTGKAAYLIPNRVKFSFDNLSLLSNSYTHIHTHSSITICCKMNNSFPFHSGYCSQYTFSRHRILFKREREREREGVCVFIYEC